MFSDNELVRVASDDSDSFGLVGDRVVSTVSLPEGELLGREGDSTETSSDSEPSGLSFTMVTASSASI